MGVLIFCATPINSFEIWLCIYICHISDVQRPNSLVVEYLYPIIFSAIAPPDWSEYAPIMSGSITLSCILRVIKAVLTALKSCLLVTSVHASLHHTSQSRFSFVSLLIGMWRTLRAVASKAPLLTVY